jgi:flavin-dependent dehydrogenase
MGLNRSPLYTRGALLVGDAAGMVSPFNGEGIGYGLQAGRLAAGVAARALAEPSAAARERILATYDAQVRAELGGFYTLGRWFTRLIENPALQRAAVRYGLPRRVVMDVVLRLFSDCYEPRGGDWVDRVVATAARWAPAA